PFLVTTAPRTICMGGSFRRNRTAIGPPIARPDWLDAVPGPWPSELSSARSSKPRVAALLSSRRPVRADKQPFFLKVHHNSIVNVKEMSNHLLGTQNFYDNLNEIDLSSHGNLTRLSLRGRCMGAPFLRKSCLKWRRTPLFGVARREITAGDMAGSIDRLTVRPRDLRRHCSFHRTAGIARRFCGVDLPARPLAGHCPSDETAAAVHLGDAAHGLT